MKHLFFFIVYSSCWMSIFAIPYDSLPIITNVQTHKKDITLDSIANGLYYYRGITTYSIQKTESPVYIHVYIEELPFKRYQILETRYGGFGRFYCIDSLCSGDVGLVSQGSNRKVIWKYSTRNKENHCRIKIGVGNYKYVLRARYFNDKYYSGDSTFFRSGGIRYTYNNCGLIASEIHSKKINGTDTIWNDKIWKHVYTRHGQLKTNKRRQWELRYDNKWRLIYDCEGYRGLWKYSYVYRYDSLSRSTGPISHKPLGPEPDMDRLEYPSLDDPNHEIVKYDKVGNVIYRRQTLVTDKFTCPNPYRFVGFDEKLYYPASFENGHIKYGFDAYGYYQTAHDSMVRNFINMERDSILVSRTKDYYYYNKNFKVDSIISITQGFDSVGSCWGSDTYKESKNIYTYDSHGNWIKRIEYEKKSRNEPFKKTNENERILNYDKQKNIINNYIKSEDDSLYYVTKFNRFNWPVYTSNGNRVYKWELIDLDKMEELNYE